MQSLTAGGMICLVRPTDLYYLQFRKGVILSEVNLRQQVYVVEGSRSGWLVRCP